MTQSRQARGPILIADDDEEDRMMARQALEACHPGQALRFVTDGQELLAYLRREGRYGGLDAAPRPALVLLDLNMARKNGHEALLEIKLEPELRTIPVVVFTTSEAEEDIDRSYALGAAGFVVKPVTFEAMVEAMSLLGRYWLELVRSPT